MCHGSSDLDRTAGGLNVPSEENMTRAILLFGLVALPFAALAQDAPNRPSPGEHWIAPSPCVEHCNRPTIADTACDVCNPLVPGAPMSPELVTSPDPVHNPSPVEKSVKQKSKDLATRPFVPPM
jgi:hypothetical protein